MKILNRPAQSHFIGWASAIQELLDGRGIEPAASQVRMALEQFEQARFSLAVLGKVKRGKSTLINAFLDRRDDLAAPIDRLPASSVISRFRWQERESATVLFRDGRKQSISLAQVRDFATEEANPENIKAVELLEIAGPFAGLDPSVELVDTPGAGSLHEHHDALLHAFIPHADAVIFLVTARMPLDQDELELLRNIKRADISKIFFAINRIDEAAEKDLADAVAHNTRLLEELGLPATTFHRISAKRAFEGELATSGVPEFLSEIQAFLAGQKGRTLQERLISRVRLAVEPVWNKLCLECEYGSKSQAELAEEENKFAGERQRLQNDREWAEREFRNGWARALLTFEQRLRSAETTCLAKASQQIAEASLMDVSHMVKQWPTTLQRMLEEELQAPSRTLETEILAATQKLQASYPRLETGLSRLSTTAFDDTNTLLKGAAVGAATTAVGGGFIAAGMTAAAGIASANAAAAAASTTVVAPSVLGSLLSGIPHVGGLLGSLGTGTATVSAPAAFTATPLWVALSGPVGWTLVGVGVLAVPFAWRVSKLRAKDQLEKATLDHISLVFRQLREDRLAHLRQLGDAIVEEFKVRLERQIGDMESMLEELRRRPRADRELAVSMQARDQLKQLLDSVPSVSLETACGSDA